MKTFRLAALAGALAAGSGCDSPQTYAGAVECAGWFHTVRGTTLGRDPSFWPGWAVLDARELGSRLGKDKAAIDVDLRRSIARQAAPARGSDELLNEIRQSGSTAGRCWHHYN